MDKRVKKYRRRAFKAEAQVRALENDIMRVEDIVRKSNDAKFDLLREYLLNIGIMHMNTNNIKVNRTLNAIRDLIK